MFLGLILNAEESDSKQNPLLVILPEFLAPL